MSLSRWKMMAGVLGVSIGGLAAAASQCPKLDKSKGRQAETPIAFADAPKVPPAGAPSAPAITPPAAPVPAALPTPSAELPKPATTPPTALPAIPDFTPPSPAKPADVTPPASVLPALPGVPDPGEKPLPTPPAKPPVVDAPGSPKTPFPLADLLPTPPTAPVSTPPASPTGFDFGPPAGKPTATPPVVVASGTQPSNPGVMLPPLDSNTLPPPPPVRGMGVVVPHEVTPLIEVPSSKPTVPPSVLTPPATIAATKFRILLRVGEGEPTFEVKCGDDLVMKVACEKVDIKSPEKGSGLSAVTAKGKVRFAGFGVEGTCDELSFMAGTGEVSMTGEVKVQVKDKLGRVESELTTATLKYKIDASAVGNSIKP